MIGCPTKGDVVKRWTNESVSEKLLAAAAAALMSAGKQRRQLKALHRAWTTSDAVIALIRLYYSNHDIHRPNELATE